MARVLTCGFESGGAQPYDAEAGEGNFTGFAPDIQTTVKRTGTHAMASRTDVFSSGFYATLRNAGGGFYAAGETIITRMYYRFPTAPGAAVIITRGAASNDQEAWALSLNANRTLAFKNSVANVTKTTTFALTANTWYRIEVKHIIHDTTGEIRLRITSDDDISPTLHEEVVINSADAAGDTLPSWGNIGRVGFGSNNPFLGYYDDLAINDAAGSFQNDWPGAGHIIAVRPDADVAVAWNKAGSAPAMTNFEGVDEAVPNDGVDFNEINNATAEDKLGLPLASSEIPDSADILVLDVYARKGGNQTASAAELKLAIWDEGGTRTQGPTINAAINGWAALSPHEHLAFDPGTDTKTTLATYSAGYTATLGSTIKRISTLWVNVEFKAVAAIGISVTPSPLVLTYQLTTPQILLDEATPVTQVTPSPLVLTYLMQPVTVIVFTVGDHPGLPFLVRIQEGRHHLKQVAAGTEVYLEAEVRDMTKSVPTPMDPSGGVRMTLIDPCGQVIISDSPMSQVVNALGQPIKGRYRIRHQTRLDAEKGLWTGSFRTISSGRVGQGPVEGFFRLM